MNEPLELLDSAGTVTQAATTRTSTTTLATALSNFGGAGSIGLGAIKALNTRAAVHRACVMPSVRFTEKSLTTSAMRTAYISPSVSPPSEPQQHLPLNEEYYMWAFPLP